MCLRCQAGCKAQNQWLHMRHANAKMHKQVLIAPCPQGPPWSHTRSCGTDGRLDQPSSHLSWFRSKNGDPSKPQEHAIARATAINVEYMSIEWYSPRPKIHTVSCLPHASTLDLKSAALPQTFCGLQAGRLALLLLQIRKCHTVPKTCPKEKRVLHCPKQKPQKIAVFLNLHGSTSWRA